MNRTLVCSSALAVAIVLGTSGCATTGSPPSSGPAADAPTYRVGDRWVYHVEDGFRVKSVWDETHEITAIGADGITVRVTQMGPSTNATRTEIWSAPGQVKVGSVYGNEMRRFAVPLQEYNFPLASGKVWDQRVDNYNEATKLSGNINRWVRVSGWEKVATPAGTYDAVQMQVIMRLDDDTFWREATECNYAVWYAPAVGAPVREQKNAQYREKDGGLDGGSLVRTEYATQELTSFTPGR